MAMAMPGAGVAHVLGQAVPAALRGKVQLREGGRPPVAGPAVRWTRVVGIVIVGMGIGMILADLIRWIRN